MSRKNAKNKINKKSQQRGQRHIPDNIGHIEKDEERDITNQQIVQIPKSDDLNKNITINQYRANLIMTGVTVCLFLLTIYQSYLTRASVESAIEAVNLSKKQFEVQNQPLLEVKSEGSKINFMAGGQIAITYMVSNSGDFPAKIIMDRPVLIIRENRAESEDILREVFEEEFQKSKEYEKNILISKSPALLITKSTFKDEKIESQIKEGKSMAIYGGELTYQDRLTNKKYKLKYAFVFVVVSWPNNILADGIIYSTSEFFE